MFGLLINEREKRELEYVIKRELEEILFDMGDHRIDEIVKKSMSKRYKDLFSLFCRIADEEERVKYIPKRLINK